MATVWILSKCRQTTVKHFRSSVVSVNSSSVSVESFWYESLAIMRNFPIAGNNSSGKRFKCGPVSFFISFQSGAVSKSNFNWSSHISTNPATNWRKQSLSFCYIFFRGEENEQFFLLKFLFQCKQCSDFHKTVYIREKSHVAL